MNNQENTPEKSGERRLALLEAVARLDRVDGPEMLMKGIVSEARALTGAEAGTVYLKDGDLLIFAHSQNDMLARGAPGGEFYLGGARAFGPDDEGLAPYVAKEGLALNVPDAYDIPLSAPYNYNPAIDRRNGYVSKSIFSLPLISADNDFLGVLQLINKLGPGRKILPFDEDDERLMGFFVGRAGPALGRARIMRHLILGGIKLASLRDPLENKAHAQRVAAMSAGLYSRWAERRDLKEEDTRRTLDLLHTAALLHDVGKAGVPENILTKPGRLSAEERRLMQNHVLIGAELFSGRETPLDRLAWDLIMNHHERWDGGGYPGRQDATELPADIHKGKRGEEISVFGRVAAVADVFDALTSRRTYKESFDEDLACQIMRQESGRHFDPEIVGLFLDDIRHVRTVFERYPDKQD